MNIEEQYCNCLRDIAKKRVETILKMSHPSATKTIVVMVRDDISNKYTLICEQTLKHEVSIGNATYKIMSILRDEEQIDNLTVSMLNKVKNEEAE